MQNQMFRRLKMLCLAAALAGGTTANAASIDFPGSNLNGNGVIDNSTSGLLSVSVDLDNLAPIDLLIQLDGAELGGTIDFNADFLIQNGLSVPVYGVEILTAGVVFGTVGDAIDSFGNSAATAGTQTYQNIDFDPDEDLLFVIGDPLLEGYQDWSLDVSGLAPGTDTIGVRLMIVPEPGTALLLVFGLAALAQRKRYVRA